MFTVPDSPTAKLMYYLDCVAVVIKLEDRNLNRLRNYSSYYLLNDTEIDAFLVLVVQMFWLVKYSSPTKTVGSAEIGSLSWVQLLTCWLCQTTLWLEEKGGELLKSCSLRDAGWKTTTFYLWGHSKVVCKGWHAVCQAGHHLRPEHYLHQDLALLHSADLTLLLRHLVAIFCSELNLMSDNTISAERLKVAEHSFRACFCWCNI